MTDSRARVAGAILQKICSFCPKEVKYRQLASRILHICTTSMVIERLVSGKFLESLEPGKVLVLYGPRRSGKTFLLEHLRGELERNGRVLFLKGESRIVQENLSTEIPERLVSYIGDAKTLVIDEAQKVPSIGLNLKLIVDSMPDLTVIASGSASFDLAQKIGEPLTGRKKTLLLFPVSAREIIQTFDTNHYLSTLETSLIYGGYPELFSLPSDDDRRDYLSGLIDSLLLKDILDMEQVKGAKKLFDLLTLIAFQIGREVSLTELGSALDLHKDTVARYLDLLEKSFIVKNIRGFSRNLRKEVTKNSRYYFYDNGVRNAVINNWNPISRRDDIGMLWENYIVMERLKKQSYLNLRSNNHFWRTYDQKEIDWVEEREGKLFGYEIKWSDDSPKAPSSWIETYPGASYEVVNRDNFLDFIG